MFWQCYSTCVLHGLIASTPRTCVPPALNPCPYLQIDLREEAGHHTERHPHGGLQVLYGIRPAGSVRHVLSGKSGEQRAGPPFAPAALQWHVLFT